MIFSEKKFLVTVITSIKSYIKTLIMIGAFAYVLKLLNMLLGIEYAFIHLISINYISLKIRNLFCVKKSMIKVS